jgi:threonylcarbamoyladenosine tRNA methylthiotransferase MtaB
MPVSPAPELVTLGCRLNIAESEVLRRWLGPVGERVVVNSCAVTAQAVAESRAAVRRARRRRPAAELVVTGCAATIDPAAFAAMPEVDRVLPNAAKLWPASWGSRLNRAPIAAFARHARAFVAVQTGCDHRCTFCIIPAGRGPARSEPAAAVAEQVAAQVAAGHREAVLTGVDLASWGRDLPGTPGLAALVAAVLAVPGLERLRLSSLDPAAIDDALLALFAEPRLMPHAHLSLQAGDDLVLKRMRRRHARADAVRLVERLKRVRPDVSIGADLIAGFPTESEEQAAATLALLDDCDIVQAHVFAYSPRAGTPAARMPQVAPELRRARAARLRDAAARRRARWLAAQVGEVRAVLVERPGDRGHAPDFAEVRLAAPAAPGTIVSACITAAAGDHLVGTAA